MTDPPYVRLGVPVTDPASIGLGVLMTDPAYVYIKALKPHFKKNRVLLLTCPSDRTRRARASPNSGVALSSERFVPPPTRDSSNSIGTVKG